MIMRGESSGAKKIRYLATKVGEELLESTIKRTTSLPSHIYQRNQNQNVWKTSQPTQQKKATMSNQALTSAASPKESSIEKLPELDI